MNEELRRKQKVISFSVTSSDFWFDLYEAKWIDPLLHLMAILYGLCQKFLCGFVPDLSYFQFGIIGNSNVG